MWGLHWTSGTVRMAQRLVHQKMVLLYPCAHASWTMCDLCCGVYQRTHICRIYIYVLCCAKLLQLCPALCNPVDCSPPGSSVHGMLQARILEWVSMPSSRGSSPPSDRTQVSYVLHTGRRVLYHCATWETYKLDTVFGPKYLK